MARMITGLEQITAEQIIATRCYDPKSPSVFTNLKAIQNLYTLLHLCNQPFHLCCISLFTITHEHTDIVSITHHKYVYTYLLYNIFATLYSTPHHQHGSSILAKCILIKSTLACLSFGQKKVQCMSHVQRCLMCLSKTTMHTRINGVVLAFYSKAACIVNVCTCKALNCYFFYLLRIL